MSRHLVDPQFLPMLDLFDIKFSAETLHAIRQRPLLAPPDTLPVVVEDLTIDGPAGAPPVRLRVYRPDRAASPLPALFHIHGGGYVVGSPEMMDVQQRSLVADLDCVIVSVDYRLAPETRFPGAVEDCYAALQWVSRNAVELGIDQTRMGLMGESAGGGLAASLALLVRDRGDMMPRFQHLIYPMLDDRTCTSADRHPFTGDFLWTHESNEFGWSALLGAAPGGTDVSPYAAAARATDLSGLPPCFISVGALDLFLEENLEYARRLTRAGVPVELHVYPGAFHGFQLADTARVSQDAVRHSRAALRWGLYG